MKITHKFENNHTYKLYCISLLCIIIITIIYNINTKIYIEDITKINKFRNCIFTKQKDTECRVDIDNYTFNLTNCHYDNDFWNFCECCPKATLLGNELKNSFCPHEGNVNLMSRLGNFTVECGSELFQPLK